MDYVGAKTSDRGKKVWNDEEKQMMFWSKYLQEYFAFIWQEITVRQSSFVESLLLVESFLLIKIDQDYF